MKYLSIMCILFLVGCSSNPLKDVTKDHYIVREIPAEYFVLPEPVQDIELSTATQKDLSLWIVNVDTRMSILETKLLGAKKVQDENVKAANVK